MSNVRAKVSLLGFPVELPDEEDVPGFHVQVPEEDVPGFRINADGSIRDTKIPAAGLYPGVRNNPFYPFNQQGMDANAVTLIGDGSPSPYLAYARGLYNGLSGMPPLGADALQPNMSPSAFPSSGESPFSSLPIAEATTVGHPFVPSPQSSAFGNGQRPSPASFNYAANTSPVFGQRPPLASTGPISDEGVSMAEADAVNAVARDAGQASGDHGVDPNIVRVADPLSPTNRNEPMPSPTLSRMIRAPRASAQYLRPRHRRRHPSCEKIHRRACRSFCRIDQPSSIGNLRRDC